jgi:hypothetical protein
MLTSTGLSFPEGISQPIRRDYVTCAVALQQPKQTVRQPARVVACAVFAFIASTGATEKTGLSLSSMFSLWSEFLLELHQPEYVHVLLNPLPIYGLALALLASILALVLRNREAQTVALILIVLTAAAAWPVSYFGSAGYDRVYSMSDESAQKWLNWHAYLADRIVWAHTVAAALAAITLAARWKFPRWQHPALILTLAATVTAVGLGGFLGFVGGKIRHAEFRHEPPPAWAHTAPDED